MHHCVRSELQTSKFKRINEENLDTLYFNQSHVSNHLERRTLIQVGRARGGLWANVVCRWPPAPRQGGDGGGGDRGAVGGVGGGGVGAGAGGCKRGAADGLSAAGADCSSLCCHLQAAAASPAAAAGCCQADKPSPNNQPTSTDQRPANVNQKPTFHMNQLTNQLQSTTRESNTLFSAQPL